FTIYASLNRPWPNNENTVIVDPFAGTGTTWLEALKFPNTTAECSDLSPMVHLLVQDNALFFGWNVADLDNLTARYEKFLDPERAETLDMFLDSEAGPDPYRLAREFLDQLRTTGSADSQTFTLTDEVISRLETGTFLQRLVFYTAFRAELRFKGAFERGSRKWVEAFQESAKDLLEQMRSFREWRASAEQVIEEHGSVTIFSGQYSNWCAIGVKRLADARHQLETKSEIAICDARAIRDRSCDLVVTGPPYGFNTDDELSRLAALYSEVIHRLVRAVRNEGHLVLCLPETSYTGRALPFCTLRNLVIAQVLSAADDAERAVVLQGKSLPSPARLFRPPYYWVSERALRRVILHFQIRDRSRPPNRVAGGV
ncbi:MAG: hypothetical protein MN733_22770, partial [Nitrososphaera sp.]|nr:hypothetical protein [Nitrososphaera sp.]